MDIFLLVIGGVLLYFGAEWLVSGASRLALGLKIPQLVIGLTVVAYGTSAPEIIVSVQAAIQNRGEIALGNVIGSNIANIGLILGLSVLVKPAKVDGALRRLELPVLLGSAIALIWVLKDGHVTRLEAILLAVTAIIYTVTTVRASRGDAARAQADTQVAAEAAETGAGASPHSPLKSALLALAGLAVLLYGGHLFVEAASALARSLGMSERVLGLTIVAVGTSVPELATSLIAAFRGHSDIAVGNVVGSNIFNILLCLGLAGSLGSLATDPASLVVDLGVMMALTIVAAIFLRTARHVQRWEGAVLLLGYLGFMGYLALR